LQALEGNTSVIFLLGTGEFVTEPRALRGLLRLASQYPGKLRVLFDSDPQIFHYKLATFSQQGKTAVIIGSSNLTPKGLSSAGEVNLEIISNQTIYQKATKFLTERINKAENVAEHLSAYERRYKKAEKFRRQRRVWMESKQAAWMISSKAKSEIKMDKDRYAYCLVVEPEDDKSLIRNINKERGNAKTEGLLLFNQWIHLSSNKEFRLYGENQVFALADKFDNSFGFAVCTRKRKILDQNDSLQPVIFYRYLRGQKAQFSTKKSFYEELKKLGLHSDRTEIKTILSRRLKEYLFQKQKKS
jgi:hypothetical protein